MAAFPFSSFLIGSPLPKRLSLVLSPIDTLSLVVVTLVGVVVLPSGGDFRVGLCNFPYPS